MVVSSFCFPCLNWIVHGCKPVNKSVLVLETFELTNSEYQRNRLSGSLCRSETTQVAQSLAATNTTLIIPMNVVVYFNTTNQEDCAMNNRNQQQRDFKNSKEYIKIIKLYYSTIVFKNSQKVGPTCAVDSDRCRVDLLRTAD